MEEILREIAPAEHLNQGLISLAKVALVHAAHCDICLYKPCEQPVGQGVFAFLFETYFQSCAARQDDEGLFEKFSRVLSSPLAK